LTVVEAMRRRRRPRRQSDARVDRAAADGLDGAARRDPPLAHARAV